MRSSFVSIVSKTVLGSTFLCALYAGAVGNLYLGAQSTTEPVGTQFESSGDIAVSVEEAEATLLVNRAKIVTLNIASSPASIKKLKKSYSANLFFSKEFEPRPGKFPIEFSYRNRKNTLGGSFVSREGTFSHDTKGEAEFSEFGEQITVRFEFQTFDKSEGGEGRRVVTVRGTATCPRGDLF